jgi:hypothetical protein
MAAPLPLKEVLKHRLECLREAKESLVEHEQRLDEERAAFDARVRQERGDQDAGLEEEYDRIVDEELVSLVSKRIYVRSDRCRRSAVPSGT